MTARKAGGRRSEDFPVARERDRRILEHLTEFGPTSRNQLAAYLGLETRPRLITYALHRLRVKGLVVRLARGNEGHGTWAVSATHEGAK